MRKGPHLRWMRRRSPQKIILVSITTIALLLTTNIALISASSGITPPLFSEIANTELKVKQLLKRNNPNYSLTTMNQITIDSIDYFETLTAHTIITENGNIELEISSLINPLTEEITINSKYIQLNSQEYIEKSNQLILLVENKLIFFNNLQDKQLFYKAIDNHIEPLINPAYFSNQQLNQTQTFAVIAYTDNDLNDQLITIDGYAIHLVQSNDLEPLFRNKRILRIANNEPRNLRKLVNYARQIFREEAEKLAKDLQLRISHQDVIAYSDLKNYLNDEPWDPDPGQTSPYQRYVTPKASAVTQLSSRNSRPQDIYELARKWTWVSDTTLHNSLEKWLIPASFLEETPSYSTNPSPGTPVSDCSEQANTLCSILRASGIAPENVRVAIGEVNFDGSIGGHAWVEIKEEDKWLVLDPTCGPYYDDSQNRLFNRDGVEYDYWKYHPYPIENIWVYYNDVYYTDEKAEVAEGWSTPYDIFLDEEMLAGFFSYESQNLYYFYIFLAISSSVFLLSFIVLKTFKFKKE